MTEIRTSRKVQESAARVRPLHGFGFSRYRRGSELSPSRRDIFLPSKQSMMVTEEEYRLSQRVYAKRGPIPGIPLDSIQEWKDRGMRQFEDGIWGWLKE